MEFIRITPSDPVTAVQIDSLQDALDRAPTEREPETRTVNGGQYAVKSTDRFIVTDARGGPIRIVLPLPKVKQWLDVKNGYTTGNAVTILRVDNEPIGPVDRIIASPIASGPAVKLFCDGSQWWSL